jgi:hypothetical protein
MVPERGLEPLKIERVWRVALGRRQSSLLAKRRFGKPRVTLYQRENWARNGDPGRRSLVRLFS